jgi:hypothetical protein
MPAIWNLDPSPAEQAGVNRPDAWAEQSESGTDCCDQDGCPRSRRLRPGLPQFQPCHDGTDDGRPQADHQEQAAQDGQDRNCLDSRLRRNAEAVDP